jgi:transposase
MPARVRAVLYFNPELFVDRRLRASAQLQAIGAFIDELNTRLATACSRMTREQIVAAIDRRLRKDDLLEAFVANITQSQIDGRVRYQVMLSLDQPNWSRRRRFDGFNIVVAHPDIKLNATELCRLYRAKDAIEKDFRIIKSFVELRPVMHQTEAKVRAHVTICMLSLLLERTLHHRLKGKYSAAAAIELLETCRLNQVVAAEDGMTAYTLTELTAEQAAVLRLLRLQRLGDQVQVADEIKPR